MRKINFTKEGYEKLKEEYKQLQEDRKCAVLDLKRAREMGDLSENGYYKSARFKLSSIDARLRKSSFFLKNAVVRQHKSSDIIEIGCKISLSIDGKIITYSIVGDLEADPGSKKISLLSPLGKSLLNKKVGDFVEIKVPGGKKIYEVTGIC